jgi:hypothetical protein
MAKLMYSPIAALDGYLEDEQGQYDWAAPDDEVHAFVNELRDAQAGLQALAKCLLCVQAWGNLAPVAYSAASVAAWRLVRCSGFFSARSARRYTPGKVGA